MSFLARFLVLAFIQCLPVQAKQVMVGSFTGPNRYLQPMQSAKDLVEWIAAADRQGVRILSTPEAYIGGYPLWNVVQQSMDTDNEKRRTAFINGAIDMDGPELHLIRNAAKAHNVAVVVGANLRGEGANRYQVYNAVIFVSEKGEIVGVHRKTAPSHTERQYWAFGEAASIKPITLQGIRVMAVQCWEARNPLTVSQIALEAPDVVFLPTADNIQPEEGNYLIDMRYIGRNAHSYVLSSTVTFDWVELEKSDKELAVAWRRILPNAPMLSPGGGAAAVDPTGKVLEATKSFERELVAVIVDTDKIKESMTFHSVTDNYRLKGDYTLYIDGKKLTGNGPDSIY